MKSLVARTVQRNNSFIKFDKAYSEVLKENANYNTTAQKIINKNQELLTLIPKLEDNEKVETKIKNISRTTLVSACLPLIDLAISYGESTSFLPFQNLKKYNRSNLLTIAATKLISKVAFFVQELRDNSEATTSASITAEKVDELESKNNNFKALINLPAKKRKELKDISIKVQQNCNATNRFYQSLKRYMRGAFQTLNPTMYQDFINAINLDAIPHHKRAVMGKFYDAQTKKPLNKVQIFIDNATPITRGGKKGKFHIDHLDAGEHKICFKLKGFQDFIIEFVKIEGETYVIDVAFQSVLVEEMV